MSSLIQKILEAERKRHGRPSPDKKSVAKSARDLVASSGLFKSLSPVAIEAEVMELNKILPAIDDRGATTAFKMLRTRVLRRMRTNQWQTVVVTSAGPNEGKTLTACNLAISISNDVNQSVVLVDLDLQRPSLANCFGLKVKNCIGDYLSGNASLDDIIYAPEGMERIGIIPNRETVPNSSDLLASPKMRSLVDWLKERDPNTIIVFDMPPVLSCDDVLAFMPNADCFALVVSEGITNRRSLSKTIEMIGEYELLGVVLNQTREGESVSAYY